MLLRKFYSYVSFIAAILLVLHSEVYGIKEFEFSDIDKIKENDEWSTRTIFVEEGKLLYFSLPRYEDQNITSKEYSMKSTKLPDWLTFQNKTGLLIGVPLDRDMKTIQVTIFNFYYEIHLTIKVIKQSNICNERYIKDVHFLLDKNIYQMNAKERISVILNGAKNLGIPCDFLKMDSYSKEKLLLDQTFRISPAKMTTRIELQIGCELEDKKLLNNLLKKLKFISENNNLSSVFGYPVISWKLHSKFSQKEKRDVSLERDDYGSGDYDEDYYDNYDDDVEEKDLEQNNKIDREENHAIGMTTPIYTSTIHTVQMHPHRHHHGENRLNDSVPKASVIPDPYSSTLKTTQASPADFTSPTDISQQKKDAVNYDDNDYAWPFVDLEKSDDNDVESETVSPIFNQTTVKYTTFSSSNQSVEEIDKARFVPTYLVEKTAPTVPTTYTTTLLSTTIRSIANSDNISIENNAPTENNTSQALPVTVQVTTEADFSFISTLGIINTSTSTDAVDIESQTQPVIPILENYKPFIEKRLQHLSVAAGKIFRFIIPHNTFKDAEDGYNLTLQILDSTNQALSNNTWLQFNPLRRELYGLPLVEDVSNWVYTVRAYDKAGYYEEDQLTIQVQQHPLEKVFNHEFSIILRIEAAQEFPHYVDWSLKVLRTLGKIYHTNMSEITIRRINTTGQVATFVWSNDSLSTSHCPKLEIEELFKVLTANDRGDPSRELSALLAPNLRVKKVLYFDLGICSKQHPSSVTPGTNFSPILRNPVDRVNATLNELLIFKVKDDTFYDPEDVDPSMLNITLLTSDFKPIPLTNWLQFDSKNREFFGIPRKVSKSQYWLICVDTGGMSAKDSLEVEVYPSLKRHYNVEFSMTIDMPFEIFSKSAIFQRKFIEKLMELFEDFNPSNLYFPMFKQNLDPVESTDIYWFNKSLPIDKCPIDEIRRLEYILHNSDQKSISSKVHKIMSPEFTVSKIKVHLLGNCKNKPQVIPEVLFPTKEPTPPDPEQHEVIVTFVLPSLMIAVMLVIATIAAFVLSKRRSLGKIKIQEDSRQCSINKGIPVIFQEELDENPEPGTKAPVILKDEKAPLAPPEYSKSETIKLMKDSDAYQPPPPFIVRPQDANKYTRPKPTPTYRKPPPYERLSKYNINILSNNF